MSESYLYGLENSNHDFTKSEAFGKNVFTNAFPVALSMYMSQEKDLAPNFIQAVVDENGVPNVEHCLKPLDEIVKVQLDDALWMFEDSFSGYDDLATGNANRSDLVVKSLSSDKEMSAFELKLVTAPTSGTAEKERTAQSCELVVRPPTIEQMCFSIAASYGADRRHDIGDILASKLENPMDYQWENERFMIDKLSNVVEAAEQIICEGVDLQTPFALTALWRTLGKSTRFDEECFDVFFWTDMAFLQLFTRATRRAIDGERTSIGRPERSVVWLVKSLFDYAAQGAVTFERTHSLITYGGQTDKAGAFSGASILDLIGCENFYHPRVPDSAYKEIVLPEGIALLSPERRLDGFIKTHYDYQNIDLDDVN